MSARSHSNTSGAAAAGGRVYIGNHHGQFLCADLTRYTVLWRHKPGRKKPVLSSAAVSSEAVVFGRRDGSVTCLDLSGKLRWQFKAGDYVDSSPVICGDKVVVGSDDGRLYLLSLIDGKKLWSKDLGEAIATSPAVTAGRVFVACADGAVYAFGSAK